jgi:hypothetical protein
VVVVVEVVVVEVVIDVLEKLYFCIKVIVNSNDKLLIS